MAAAFPAHFSSRPERDQEARVEHALDMVRWVSYNVKAFGSPAHRIA